MSEQVRLLVLDPDGRPMPAAATGAGLSVHRCHDLADLLGRVAAGAADAAVLSPRAAGLDAVVVSRLRAQGCRIIAAVAGRAEVEMAGRIGIEECLAVPLDPVAVRQALQRPAAAAPVPAGQRGTGLVAAVWGPPGAPGRTTVAALLAVGAHRDGRRVIVVDADLAGGSWSLLSVQPCPGAGLHAALRRAAAGGSGMADLLVPQLDGLDLLPLAPDPQRWVEAAPAAMPLLLDELAAQADLVVVDVGSDIRSAHPAYDVGWAHDSAAVARGVVDRADAVLAVLRADPVGVHRFAAWWSVLMERTDSPIVAANMVGAPGGGRRPQEQLAAVLSSLGASGARVDVPWDPRAAEALSDGNWTAARRWRDVPQRLWSAFSRTGGLRAA